MNTKYKHCQTRPKETQPLSVEVGPNFSCPVWSEVFYPLASKTAPRLTNPSLPVQFYVLNTFPPLENSDSMHTQVLALILFLFANSFDVRSLVGGKASPGPCNVQFHSATVCVPLNSHLKNTASQIHIKTLHSPFLRRQGNEFQRDHSVIDTYSAMNSLLVTGKVLAI